MVDNFAESLNALRRFIYANVPEGVGDRIEDIEHRSNYFILEFRREDASCTLYIEIDDFSATSVMDKQGNRWRQYTVIAQPSWASYGSVPVGRAQAFLKLLSEVTAFADALMKEFSSPITKLVETAEQIADRKRKAAEEKTRHDVQALMRANVKGMRVGQERVVRLPEGPSDLLPVGLVTFCDGPRQYTTHVTATRTFCVMRTA